MNFLFVDQILELEAGKRAVGIKQVTAHDAYLYPDHAGVPTLRSCIVGECLGQLCSWVVIKATAGKMRSVGGIVSAVQMLGEARIGDTIKLEIDVDFLDEQAVNWHGHASVGDKTIFVVESSIGPCLPMTDFNDIDEVNQQLAILDRSGSFPEIPDGRLVSPLSVKYYPELVSYDRIISWETGKEVVAQKNISWLAPYLADHFPKKPVFPISLALESKLQLAFPFLAELYGEQITKEFVPERVYNIKMNDFVMPGSVLITKMTLKQHDQESAIINYRSEVNGKRVCVAEAAFKRYHK